MNEILLYLVGFSIFVVLQSLALNGIYECFKGSKFVDGVSGKIQYEGMIFYMIAPAFFEKNKFKFWAKTYTCIKCISGWAGTLSYWAAMLITFDFNWKQVPVWVFDIFILVALNGYIYKKL